MARDPLFKGEQTRFSFALESTFGETPTPGDQTIFLGIIPSASIEVVPDFNDYYSLTQASSSVQRDLFTERQAKINCSGDFPLELQNGRILYYAMGSVSESGTAPTTHIVEGTGSILQSILGEAVYAGDNQTFMRYLAGMKVNTFSLEAAEGAAVTSTVNFVNANTTRAAAGVAPSSVTVNTTKPFQFYDACLTYNNETEFRATAATWTVNNNLKPLWDICSGQTGTLIGGQYASSIEVGKRDYELRMTLLIPDHNTRAYVIWDDFISGANRDAKLKLTRGTNDYLLLDAYDCTIRTAPYNLPEVGEELRVDVVLKPRRCKWTVVDSITSYD